MFIAPNVLHLDCTMRSCLAASCAGWEADPVVKSWILRLAVTLLVTGGLPAHSQGGVLACTCRGALDADVTLAALDEAPTPGGVETFAGYESLVAEPNGRRVAISEVTYRSDGASGRLSIRAALTGGKIAAIDVQSGIAVVGWTDDGRLIARTTEVSRGRLQIRDATTLTLVSEIVGWEGFGATIVGDAVSGTASGSVLRGSMASGDIDTAVVLPSQITGDLIALLGPVDVDPAGASGWTSAS